MMSWGLKISRNSKQNFKFSFSEEQELNIGQCILVHSWWCAGCELGVQLSFKPRFECTVLFPDSKKSLKFPLISITQVSPCSVPSCGLWATSAQVKLAGLMAMLLRDPQGKQKHEF